MAILRCAPFRQAFSKICAASKTALLRRGPQFALCLRLMGERVNAGAINQKALKVRPQRENEPPHSMNAARQRFP